MRARSCRCSRGGARRRRRRAAGAARRLARVARRIDLDAWRSAPASLDLSTSPLIRSYPEFVSEATCRWLIDRARGRLSRALVYEALSKEVTVRPTRTNTAAPFNLLETDLVLVLAQLKMSACLGVPLRQFEAITVLHYDEGEEITDHFDFIDPNIPSYADDLAQRGDRIVTFLVYLNDDYGGGETAFPRLGIEHKGRRGEGLYFVNARGGRADEADAARGSAPRARARSGSSRSSCVIAQCCSRLRGRPCASARPERDAQLRSRSASRIRCTAFASPSNTMNVDPILPSRTVCHSLIGTVAEPCGVRISSS